MNRFKYALPLAALVALCLTSCAKPVPVAHAGVCAVENDGKLVSTEGHLRAGVTVLCSNIGGGDLRCGLDLADAPEGGNRVKADIVEGSGSNELERPQSGFKKGDLKLRDNLGALVRAEDRVRVTGTVRSTTNAGTNVCWITVDKIEKL